VYDAADLMVRSHHKQYPDWDPGLVGDTTKEPWKSAYVQILPTLLGYLFMKETKREPSNKELKQSIPKYGEAARNLMKQMLSETMTPAKETRDKELPQKFEHAHGEVSVTSAAKPTTAAKGGKAAAAKDTAPTKEQQEASKAEAASGQFTHTHTHTHTNIPNSLSALNSR
jgi:hypothetical protein